MPTENERKFVLRMIDNPEQLLEELKKTHVHAVIEQGYLCKDNGISVRVRKSARSDEDGFRYHLTVKKKTLRRLVENEIPIDERDFGDYWKDVSVQVHKVRIYIDDWELDFLLDSRGKVYFVLAEIEMEEGQEEPDRMPSLIEEHLLYAVEPSDDRFTNRKLSKVKYAQDLWSSLHKEVSCRAATV